MSTHTFPFAPILAENMLGAGGVFIELLVNKGAYRFNIVSIFVLGGVGAANAVIGMTPFIDNWCAIGGLVCGALTGGAIILGRSQVRMPSIFCSLSPIQDFLVNDTIQSTHCQRNIVHRLLSVFCWVDVSSCCLFIFNSAHCATLLEFLSICWPCPFGILCMVIMACCGGTRVAAMLICSFKNVQLFWSQTSK